MRAREDAPWLRAEVEGLLGQCRSELEDFSGANGCLASSAKKMEAELGASHPRTRHALTVLVDFYESWNETERASEVRQALEANGAR